MPQAATELEREQGIRAIMRERGYGRHDAEWTYDDEHGAQMSDRVAVGTLADLVAAYGREAAEELLQDAAERERFGLPPLVKPARQPV